MIRSATVLCLFIASTACIAQASVADTDNSKSIQGQSIEAQDRLSFANSSIEYPVTPSDSYILTYRRASGEPQSQTIQVAGDYSVDLDIFGKIDARGLAFTDLKARIESRVAESYARSYPSLLINKVGIFRVGLSGAIARPRFLTAWGLSRLSELFEVAAEPNASLRSIELKRRDGKSRRYDLLLALRTADASQNPVLMPGDSIVLYATSGTIMLSGAVRYEGNYELLPEEGLRDLIEKFGGGFLNIADTSRIKIDRMTARGPSVEYMDLAKAYDPSVRLDGAIAVTIPSRMENRPFVWFEGAITPNVSSSGPSKTGFSPASPSTRAVEQDATTKIARISMQIYEGEMLSYALREIKNIVSPAADLSSASLFRQWSTVPIIINLQPLISGADFGSDIQLQSYDRIFIPTMESPMSVPHGPEFRERQ